ncbi:Signal peptidase I S [bioreactor metagenome]|uniref:signal peptidase I n=1 Tax=bioreactor metagenome TaxID=1076179 RepID=A0A645IES2_9ZZZZ
MAPSIKRGDKFLVRRLKKEKLKRGDLVIYKLGIGETYHQRIIGLPGETIEIERNKDNIADVYINDKILNEPYKKLKENSPHPKAIHYAKTHIPENSYFILGDNRDMSYDSRFLSPINKRKIIGKIIYIYYPIKRVKIFK